MTFTEIYTAVMASLGPLEDEVMARIWCAVQGLEYMNYTRWPWRERLPSYIAIHTADGEVYRLADRETDDPAYFIRRPDTSTDAAIELVQVRFPDALPTLDAFPGGWVVDMVVKTNGHDMLYSGEHKSLPVAIICAMLLAMGG